jgi:hypothetical protein
LYRQSQMMARQGVLLVLRDNLDERARRSG